MTDVQCDSCGSWDVEHYAGNNYICLECENITYHEDETEEE